MSGVFNGPIGLPKTRVGTSSGSRKVTAHVFHSGDQEFSVSFHNAGEVEPFDEAGPFDDELDALDVARRGADLVVCVQVPRAPGKFVNHGADN